MKLYFKIYKNNDLILRLYRLTEQDLQAHTSSARYDDLTTRSSCIGAGLWPRPLGFKQARRNSCASVYRRKSKNTNIAWDSIRRLSANSRGGGHSVLVEKDAGIGAGFADAEYGAVGANISATSQHVLEQAELTIKVKEPQPDECVRLSRGQVLFTYLHLAADREQALALLASGVTAIAYETVTAADGTLPLLTPMSRVAGRMAIQAGAHHLEKSASGAGILLGGVPGVSPARVVVLGAGAAGCNAVEMAVGMQAQIVVIDKSIRRLEDLAERFGNRVQTEYSTTVSMRKICRCSRSRHRLCLSAGSGRSQARDTGPGCKDAAGFRRSRCLDRSGGLFRNEPSDDSCRRDLH